MVNAALFGISVDLQFALQLVPTDKKRAAEAALLDSKSWLLAPPLTPAPRSDRLVLPDAAIVLPGDYQPGLTESVEADSTTYHC
jgi:hypothetical protein